MKNLLSGFLLVLMVGLSPGWSMVPEDILTMKSISAAALSPDGRYLLYSIGQINPAKGQQEHTMYRRDLDTGKNLTVFTPADKSRGAVWRPDGQAVAYLRTNDEGVEVWIMAANGADRRRLSEGSGNFGDLHWSPDGSALAWIAQELTVPEAPGVEDRFVVADGMGYRNLGQGYRKGKRGQVFVMSVAAGQSRRLFNEPLDVRSISWSPDSERLVFEAKEEANLGLNVNTDLWSVGVDGKKLHRLTHNPGADMKPRWLPDGRIAWLRAEDPLWESAPRQIAVMDPDKGDQGPLEFHGSGFDNLIRYISNDGNDLYFIGSHKGCLDLVRADGKNHQFITDGGHDFWSVQMAAGRAVLTGASQTNPGALYLVELDSGKDDPQKPKILIDPNKRWCEKVGLTEPEPFTVEVDGRTIEGWFFKPEGLEPGEKVPVVLSIHGGPEWMYGGYFLPEFHILATHHYGVIIANPTGSTGYGFEFQAGIRGDWTGRPARELLACVDLAIEQGWADKDHLGVMGGSYGGHLAAALTTQTDRFGAAAVDRMYPELISFWGTTDEKWFPEWEFMGKPWEPEAREVYLRNSPFEKVDQVKTPTLISQGHKDFRCLAAGGQIWFSALQSLGVPSRFVRFENEGHGIRDPRNQVSYQKLLLEWFEIHLLNGANSRDNGKHE
jgi:dipeptidyl aminopeptidase/acylaminoacyl peptidase